MQSNVIDYSFENVTVNHKPVSQKNIYTDIIA